MVLQVRIPTLRVPESINDPCCDNGVFHSLINFRLEIIRKMEIIANRSSCIDEFLSKAYVRAFDRWGVLGGNIIIHKRQYHTHLIQLPYSIMSFDGFVSKFSLLKIFTYLNPALDE